MDGDTGAVCASVTRLPVLQSCPASLLQSPKGSIFSNLAISVDRVDVTGSWAGVVVFRESGMPVGEGGSDTQPKSDKLTRRQD